MTSYLQSKIYVAGHRGMEGSVIVRNLEAKGFVNSVARIQVALHDGLGPTFFSKN